MLSVCKKSVRLRDKESASVWVCTEVPLLASGPGSPTANGIQSGEEELGQWLAKEQQQPGYTSVPDSLAGLLSQRALSSSSSLRGAELG